MLGRRSAALASSGRWSARGACSRTHPITRVTGSAIGAAASTLAYAEGRVVVVVVVVVVLRSARESWACAALPALPTAPPATCVGGGEDWSRQHALTTADVQRAPS
jgi:hypothetical protein